MSKYRATEVQFSLKDQLFNQATVKRLAREIKVAYPDFAEQTFVRTVVAGFPQQALMERLRAITAALRVHLPADYPTALAVILAALPPPLDAKKTDDDFGEFIYGPYAYFVAEYGCQKQYLKRSLHALEEITQRFTAEGALRDFLITFPAETLAEVAQWTKSSNYHVRRLASEGTRPNLPWAKNVNLQPADTISLLDNLYTDKTRYVTRSVANHLNDLSKSHDDLVIKTLQRWQQTNTATDVHFIMTHALRSLVKAGHPKALKLLGYTKPKLTVGDLALKTSNVPIGSDLEFTVTITSTSQVPQDLMIDYVLYFKKANGTLSPKTFKIAKKTLQAGESIVIQKRHSIHPMSTRTLYAGTHELQMQINGEQSKRYKFELI